MALASVGLGIFLLIVAAELIPGVTRQANDAPNPIIALAGLVFIIAGCMVFLGSKSRANDLLAAVLCALFGVIAAWVSLFGASGGFSGGLPFVGHESNISIARVAFGLGSIMCFALAAWAFMRFARTTHLQDEVAVPLTNSTTDSTSSDDNGKDGSL